MQNYLKNTYFIILLKSINKFTKSFSMQPFDFLFRTDVNHPENVQKTLKVDIISNKECQEIHI